MPFSHILRRSTSISISTKVSFSTSHSLYSCARLRKTMTKMNNQNEQEFPSFEPTQNMRICFVNADEDDKVAEDESSAGTAASTMRFTVRSGGLMFYKIRKNYKELFAEVGELKRYTVHSDRSGRSKGTSIGLQRMLQSPFFVCSCLTGYTQTINDCYDRDIDAINEPYSPIPSGAISEQEVITQVWVLLLRGLGIACGQDIPLPLCSILLWVDHCCLIYTLLHLES